MIGDASNDDDHVRAFLQTEYTALRGELIKRVEFRQRLLEIAVVSAGAILALNLTWDQYPLILLAYPIVVMFLGLGWMHHDQQLRNIHHIHQDADRARVPATVRRRREPGGV